MPTTPNMALTTWGPNDYFNDLQLKANWEKVDLHDHDPDNDGGVRIDTNGIVDEAITSLKLADSSVTNAKIVDGTITKFKLANDLLVALERAADALSLETSFGTGTTSDVTGTYDNLQIKDASIVDTHIATGAQIAASKLDIPTFSGRNLSPSNGVVDAAATAGGDLSGTFGALNIAASAVGQAELATNAVSNVKIVDGAVNSAKIEDLSITGGDIANGTISAGKTSNDGWTTYNMSLGALAGSAPAIGVNTDVSTKYLRIHKLVVVQIVIRCGSGGFGSGGSFVWTFGLPFASTSVIVGSWARRWEAGIYSFWDSGQCMTTLGSTSFLCRDLKPGTTNFTWLDSASQGGGFWPDGTQFSAQLVYEAP